MLNKTNLVSSQYNNEYRIEFTPPLQIKEETKLAFVNSQLYYSFFNIDAQFYNNNYFSYTWIDGKEYPVYIKDGGYELADIYNYFIIEMIKNKHYVITSDNLYRYYLKFSISSTYYRVDVQFFPIETQEQVTENNYSVPEVADWTFPTSYKTTFNENDTIDYSTNENRDWRAAFMRLNFPAPYETNKLFGFSENGIIPSES